MMIAMGVSPVFAKRPLSGPSPPVAYSGTTVWLDAAMGLYQLSDGTTPAVAEADPVGYIGDQSGTNHHLIQATVGNRPVLALAAMNGRPVVRWDGTSDFLATVGVPQVTTEYSIFMAVKIRNFTGALQRFLQIGGSTNGYSTYVSSSNVRQISHLGSGVAAMMDGTATNETEIWSISRSAATGARLWINGIEQALTNNTSNPVAPTGDMRLGASSTPGSYSQLDLGEFILRDRPSSVPEIDSYNAYLMGKFIP